MQLTRWLPVALVGAAFACSTDVLAKARERVEEVVPFDAGGTFRVENKNGSITIKTWNEASVRIEAEKVAKREADLENIDVVIEGSGSSVSVETVHRRRRRSGGAVNYNILIPAEAIVDVQTANGAVVVQGIHGRVTAKSVNGSLKIEKMTGEVAATTTNGSIRARYDRATDGRHSFKTTNGSVRVYLPSDAGGEFEANTVNGSIDVDFATNLTRQTRRHKRGSFGSGGGSFDFETVNGSVKILQN